MDHKVNDHSPLYEDHQLTKLQLAPTSLTNGPPFLELECEWVRDVLERMRTENLSTIDAKREKAEAWRDQVLQLAEGTLAIHTNSW